MQLSYLSSHFQLQGLEMKFAWLYTLFWALLYIVVGYLWDLKVKFVWTDTPFWALLYTSIRIQFELIQIHTQFE